MPTNDQIILKQLLEDRKRELAPDMSESRYLELFVTEQILKDYDVSYDELEAGIVGDSQDGGIDSIHVFVNGDLLHEDTDLGIYRGDINLEVHVTQAKRSEGFSEDAILRLQGSSKDLLDLSKNLGSLKHVYNSKLLDVIGKFRETYTRFASKLPKLYLRFYYATMASDVHPNVRRQVNALKETVRYLFSSAEFSFDFLGAGELLQLARTQRRTSYILKLAETPISVNNSFICLVYLKDYREFLTDEQGRYRKAIFDANVRDYQGDVEVNKAIRQSIQEPGEEDFWWLNNGVTIIASEATHSGKMLTIRDPQIVNGLQTSHEIFRALSADPGTDDRSILVRVIIAKSLTIYQHIVRATNSQTSVPPASLRATDLIHRNIEDYLKSHRIYYERRKNYYKNEGRPRESIVSISFLAQAIMAIVLARPDDARARPSTLIKNDEDYQEVFNPDYPVNLFLFSIQLTKVVEAFLRSKGFSANEVNNLRFHLCMFATRFVLNSPRPHVSQIVTVRLEDMQDEEFLEKCLIEVISIFEECGADDQASKGPRFVESLKQRLNDLSYQGRITGKV
jgi:hypothetical protein